MHRAGKMSGARLQTSPAGTVGRDWLDGGSTVGAGPSLSSADATGESQLAGLQRMYGPHLFTYLIKITLGDRQRAEDLLQETFLRAWRYLQAHNDVDLETFRPWLFTVARRLMIDSLRARRARPPEVMYEDIGPDSHTHNAIDDMVTAETVREALLRLRPEQRDLLLQLYHHGRSLTETAEKLKIPIGTVKSRTHLAKRALRAALDAVGHGDG